MRSNFTLPKRRFWKGVTKDEMRIFEALFKGVSTQFGQRTIEKCFENPHYIFCYSFQNLRLGSINLQADECMTRATLAKCFANALSRCWPVRDVNASNACDTFHEKYLSRLQDDVSRAASQKVALSALGRNGYEKGR